jgi:hypothetical protein
MAGCPARHELPLGMFEVAERPGFNTSRTAGPCARRAGMRIAHDLPFGSWHDPRMTTAPLPAPVLDDEHAAAPIATAAIPAAANILIRIDLSFAPFSVPTVK